MIERVPYYGWPRSTPTNAERIEAWRRKYALVPIEYQVKPFDRSEAPARQGVPPEPPPHCRVGGLISPRNRNGVGLNELLAANHNGART